MTENKNPCSDPSAEFERQRKRKVLLFTAILGCIFLVVLWFIFRPAPVKPQEGAAGINTSVPDGKAQVSVEYEDGTPKRISTVVVSAQHSAEVGIDALRDAILEQVIFPVLPPELLDEHTEYFINPTGRFVVGGPAGDSGLTGRKIIADTYGGMARHGGGAFSGKDPSKVDRTGAYMARYLAKNIVAAELADRCEIELAYAIGLADPVSVMVDTFGTGRVSDEKIASWLMEHIDMRPGSITSRFELRRPIYRRVSCGGHFGENAVGLPWEWTDIAEVLQKEILS